MSQFSAWSVFWNGLSGQKGWTRQWRDSEPQTKYDVVIIGGGLHGLATAYYLAKNHDVGKIAVLEKGWIGGGNAGRNTTIVRSNYVLPGNREFYEHSLQLWEELSHELNYNVMFSQRSHVTLLHNPGAVDAVARRYNTMRLTGNNDVEMWDLERLKATIPHLNYAPSARFPITGAAVQTRAGTARHDAVIWGYARAADKLGVDIIQQCEVTGIRQSRGKVTGVETTKGLIKAKKVGVVVAGHSSMLADMAGFRLPVNSYPLQALVSEPVKPVLDTVVMSNTVHVYVSQSDKGEMVLGAGIDGAHGYTQRGSLHVIEDQLGALCELFPIFSRLRMMRQWGGIVDTCPDASPIVGKTPIGGLFINCGWGTGGFKGTPGSGWAFAHTLATGEPHELNAPFNLDRFTTGALIDEHGAAAVAH